MFGSTFRGDDKEKTLLGVSIRHISDFRAVSNKAVLIMTKTKPIDILADEMGHSPSRVSRTNSSHKSVRTKDFHAQIATHDGRTV